MKLRDDIWDDGKSVLFSIARVVVVFSIIIIFFNIVSYLLAPNFESEYSNTLDIKVKNVKDSNFQATCNINFTLQQFNNSNYDIKCIINNDIYQKNLFDQIPSLTENNQHNLVLTQSAQMVDTKTIISTYSNSQDYIMSLFGTSQLFPYDSYLLNLTFILPDAIIYQNDTLIKFYTWPGDWGHSNQNIVFNHMDGQTQIKTQLVINRENELKGYVDYIFYLILILNFLVYFGLYDQPAENYSSYITLIFALTGLYITGLPSFPVKSVFNLIKYRIFGLTVTIIIPFYIKIVKKYAKKGEPIPSNSDLFRMNLWYYWVFYTILFIAPNFNYVWLNWTSFLGPDIVYLILLVMMNQLSKNFEKKAFDDQS